MKEDIKSYLDIPIGWKKVPVGNIPYIGGKSMGDAFVLHNELSQYYSLSDDWVLAQAFVGSNDSEAHWKKGESGRTNLS